MWDEGVGDKIQRRQGWLERHADRITSALLAAERDPEMHGRRWKGHL
ncbi:hypothetical protein [Kribbella deserti]|uniref:Uncharacterized protein n=1 Tax=Kribbella deserti TaxID=1926257 RepID=A0ABV6QL20_9ACTN